MIGRRRITELIKGPLSDSVLERATDGAIASYITTLNIVFKHRMKSSLVRSPVHISREHGNKYIIA